MAYTKLNTFHLFAGAGGGILGDVLLGHNPIGACEIEPYPRDVLLARQADGHLPDFPIWDDVATLDGNPWRGTVDVLCGGFPCQDISAAGKGAGITGERSGLWKEYARLIGEMRPRFVFAENSPLLRTRGLGVVLEDLAALGYNARWGIIGAGAIGAPHKRDRMWVLAYSNSAGQQQGNEEMERRPAEQLDRSSVHTGHMANSSNERLQGRTRATVTDAKRRKESDGYTAECGGLWWEIDPATIGAGSDILQANVTPEPIVGRVAHGVANRIHRLKAIGNGQVPQCAAVAFSILSEGLL